MAGNTLHKWCCHGLLLWGKGSSKQGLSRAKAKGRAGGGVVRVGDCSSRREQQEGGR